MDDLIAALCFQLQPDAESVDGWRELIPAPGADGFVRGEDGRSWRMSDPDAVVAAFTRPRSIDANHAEELQAPKGEDAPAYGWIEEIKAVNGAIHGRLAFNERGTHAVRNRDYRYLSPVFSHTKDEAREIRRIDNAALVNTPNFAKALNRAGTPERDTSTDAQDTAMTLLEQLIAKLNLPSDTDEAKAMNAVESLGTELQTARNRATTPSLDKFVPRGDYDQALVRAKNAEEKLTAHELEQTEAKVNTAIDGALKAGKITPATSDYHRAQCRADGGLERFEKFIEAAPVIGDPSELEDKPTAKAKNAAGELDDHQRAACRALGQDEAAFAKNIAADVEAHG